MATRAQWISGARPRTFPAAVAPVLVGTGAAVGLGAVRPGRALAALVVALALQIGVNYANDYSDGIRGTDDDRVGPFRLIGSGAAAPHAVRRAAFAAFGAAAVAGLALVAASGAWWLLAVGAACILAAWYYTGGSRPYGYSGLGEVFVFVFFGLVAVLGTTYTQALAVDLPALAGAVGIGALACAILVANNLRDIADRRGRGQADPGGPPGTTPDPAVLRGADPRLGRSGGRRGRQPSFVVTPAGSRGSSGRGPAAAGGPRRSRRTAAPARPEGHREAGTPLRPRARPRARPLTDRARYGGHDGTVPDRGTAERKTPAPRPLTVGR